MSLSSPDQTAAPLGIGAIIGESFTILFRHLGPVVLLTLVPTLVGVAASGLLVGWDVTLGTGEPALDGSGSVVAFVVSTIIQLVLNAVATALLVQLAYDAKLQRPLSLGRYVGPAMGAVVPIAILALAAGILTGLATLALILPGLWVYAVFSVMPAAVVIEKVGFGGLGRSADLTKGYRWPIVGAFVLLFIVTIVISIAATFLVGLLFNAVGAGGLGLGIGVLAFSALNALGYGLNSITVALIYARLREVKEGASVRDIAAVFD